MVARTIPFNKIAPLVPTLNDIRPITSVSLIFKLLENIIFNDLETFINNSPSFIREV